MSQFPAEPRTSPVSETPVSLKDETGRGPRTFDAEAPILGRSNVARAFGLTVSALKRWRRDDEAGISAFVFMYGNRLATTRRDVARFLDHVRATSPREEALRRAEHLNRTASGRGPAVKREEEGRPARPLLISERSPA